MDIHWSKLHRIHIDDYWKNFEKGLEARNTEEQYISYFMFQIDNEEKRLNRYYNDLKPQLYTDHSLAINEQKLLLQNLKKCYHQFLQGDNINDSYERIKLNYGAKNEDAIDLLFHKLRLQFISCSLDDFQLHFEEYDKEISKIKWLGVEAAICHLFNSLKLLNGHWGDVVVVNFLNKSGKPFKKEQLISIGSNRIQDAYKGKEVIENILEQIKFL